MPVNIKPTPEQQAGIDQLTENLKTLRAAAGLSQQDLANRVGIGRKTYINYEKGQSPMPWNIYLAFMCFFLHCENTRKLVQALGLEVPGWATN